MCVCIHTHTYVKFRLLSISECVQFLYYVRIINKLFCTDCIYHLIILKIPVCVCVCVCLMQKKSKI